MERWESGELGRVRAGCLGCMSNKREDQGGKGTGRGSQVEVHLIIEREKGSGRLI